mmetsp:Transcript_26395/g.57593  ORF Transcript_26395/g.57593 Transcript_26395/m.57593 type:complete len:224 (-) Transcript_26395:569-1240(-)|eukprot:CAMPEP_0202920500 /NCGR_PEP_ID=MMETSP1392-20130828/76890_1 /ASSEMBLY_ACC=CAM_ASM_000868 /TAXON_ID=225041 /ORGANISM="Chlamydomonas chlamydogama, Strain SAG 11-48b" /LENGTH=223 /DNA_ID=CAMNT_0049613997 /DNA_START=142 /DNA_END=813 /DNA_ORIENTATION=+
MTLFASTSSLSSSLGRSTRSPGRRRPKEEDQTVFGYETPPDTPALHREVFKWVQSLDLSHALKNVRRDTANGFLVAEVFSRYFPADIQMHSFANAVSSHYKRDNWAQLKRFCDKQGINLPPDLVEGTIQGVHGAAVALLEHLYELFTGKKVQRMAATTATAVGTATVVGAAIGGAAAGPGGETGGRLISSQLKTAANVEFGAVQTQAIGDAVALRRKLASGGT